MKTCTCISLLLTAGAIVACSVEDPPSRLVLQNAPPGTRAFSPPSSDAPAPIDYPGLANLVAYAPRLISGGEPEGDEGFDTLRTMGVKTIISVDGARPDAGKARALGMRYIHLPIGYNGMDKERTLEIARAVELARDEGPVYIHCHHGKHRSAGAAGAVAVTLGLLTATEATARMRVSGTSPEYAGLYRCVAVAEPAGHETLESISADFPEVWGTSGMVRTMVEIDLTFEHLTEIESAGWSAPRDHPDLVAAAEAGRLSDLFRVLGDDARVSARPAEFKAWLLAASKNASSVEEGLTQGRTNPRQLTLKLRAVTDSCKRCHSKYRD